MSIAINSGTTWQTRVPHHARSAAAVRRWLASALGSTCPDLMEDLHAVSTELICNAVRHAPPLPEGDIWVHCELNDDTIEFSVTDGGAETPPCMRKLDTTSPNGRGLLIVTALAHQWGVRDGIDSRTVWARMTGTPTPAVSGP
ncbi:MAG TPA: ATP-binding protein [Candidatus Stackebrandtia faecavium]|nr:ATP-binding protein [Candidatus Stackebrandtia faecavium]